jgi:hypothetical protein
MKESRKIAVRVFNNELSLIYLFDIKIPYVQLTRSHPRFRGDPAISWIPAFAGMTTYIIQMRHFQIREV